MTSTTRTRFALAALALIALPVAAQMPPPEVRLDEGLPAVLQAAAIDQRLGDQVPLDATFVDSTGT